MSSFYKENNNETSLELFNKKLIYKFDVLASGYSNLIDFNFAEKRLYGRVSKLFEPIVVKNYVLELKSIPLGSDSKQNFSALNFVADAFGDLAKLFQRKSMKNEIDAKDPFLAQLAVHKAYENSKGLYNAHMEQYLEALDELFQEDNVKFVTFDKFSVIVVLPAVPAAA